jgi:hypothetical protein
VVKRRRRNENRKPSLRFCLQAVEEGDLASGKRVAVVDVDRARSPRTNPTGSLRKKEFQNSKVVGRERLVGETVEGSRSGSKISLLNFWGTGNLSSSWLEATSRFPHWPHSPPTWIGGKARGACMYPIPPALPEKRSAEHDQLSLYFGCPALEICTTLPWMENDLHLYSAPEQPQS